MEARLGRSSLRLVYIYSSRKAFLIYTYIILDRYSRGYIRLVYAIGIQLQIYIRLLPIITAIARALSTISICLICAFSITYLILSSQGQGLGSGLYTLISICFFQAYTKYILTIVVPEAARVSSTSHLRIIKVYNYKITYSKRILSVCQSEIEILMLPQLDISICSAYTQAMQYILVAYTIVLQRSSNITAVVDIRRVYTGYILITQLAYFIQWLVECIYPVYTFYVLYNIYNLLNSYYRFLFQNKNYFIYTLYIQKLSGVRS